MKCPKCQTENPEDSIFCLQCGAKLIEDVQPVCPTCSTKLPSGARFCNKCGHSLTEQVPTPTAEAPTSPEPTSFTAGRYQVKRFLGEGGKKKEICEGNII